MRKVANSNSIGRLIQREALHAGNQLARCLEPTCDKKEEFKGAVYCKDHTRSTNEESK